MEEVTIKEKAKAYDKLKAEIERLQEFFIHERDDFEKGYHCSLNSLHSFINKLEKQQGKTALKAIKEEKVDNRNYVKLTWSEKDKKLLNDAISLADECDDIELRDWLKSFRP